MRTQVSPLTVADCVDMPYSPALLLDSKFDASITDDPEFRAACETGFDAYFESMYQWNEARTDTVFVGRRFSRGGVLAFVAENVFAEDEHDGLLLVGWRGGFLLGWLSALALTDRVTATQALAVVEVLLMPSGKCVRRLLVA